MVYFPKSKLIMVQKHCWLQFKQPKVMGEFLDVGCGYGPIGITLAKQFPERSIVMVDVNERAIHLAQENIELNDLENAKVRFSDGLSTVKDEQFASVVTNPPFRAGQESSSSNHGRKLRCIKARGRIMGRGTEKTRSTFIKE